MKNSLSSRDLEVKAVGMAIECRTLTVLLDTITEPQPVLVMPLERAVKHDHLSISQWIVHVTTRRDLASPIYFVSLRAAEVTQRSIGPSLTMPIQQECLKEPATRAVHFQEQLYDCIVALLSRSSRVSQIIPAHHCLPNEWIWSSSASEPRIQFCNGSWTLITPTL
jgi:hypothetical protein